MTTVQRKSLLKKLIEAERDPSILELVGNVLERRTRAVPFDSPMVKRVLKSERSVKAGRLIPWEVVSAEMDTLIDGLYPAPLKSAKRASQAKRKA